MAQQNRRAALTTLSALWLTACGGASGDGDEASATSQAQAAGRDDAATAPPAPAPAPAPTPAPAPAPVPGSPVSVLGDPPQFLIWDGGSGPSRDFWSSHLQIRWKNANVGDWLDAKQSPQGTLPYTSLSVTKALQVYEFDITALAARWVKTGENRGAMLRSTGASSATWAGRQAADAATRPLLVIKTNLGTFHCPCLSLASYSPTSSKGVMTRLRAKSQPSSPVIAQFDLKGVSGTVASAKMRLYCEAKSSTALDVAVYEVDAPRFQLGTGGIPPTLGVAAKYPGDVNLRKHPDVISAGDFSDLTSGAVFSGVQTNEKFNPYQQLPDPDAPGTTMFRGSFLPSPTDAGLARGSFSGGVQTMSVDESDPLKPAKTPVTEELFCRLYIFLEDDWDSMRDGNKMAIGWDLRMGWWNDAAGGYFQSTTGNGGIPGTGLKLYAPAYKNGGSQRYDRWEYQGHSIRMEAGRGINDGNPYRDLRPMQSYTYSLDQVGVYGHNFRLGRGVIGKGRWHCIEQQIKINSVVGPFDGLGNGKAVADGVLRTWLDGVLCSEITTLRWRRNLEMGVEGPWLCWFYGGKRPTEVPMHYRMNHFALARKYIGPRVA